MCELRISGNSRWFSGPWLCAEIFNYLQQIFSSSSVDSDPINRNIKTKKSKSKKVQGCLSVRDDMNWCWFFCQLLQVQSTYLLTCHFESSSSAWASGHWVRENRTEAWVLFGLGMMQYVVQIQHGINSTCDLTSGTHLS